MQYQIKATTGEFTSGYWLTPFEPYDKVFFRNKNGALICGEFIFHKKGQCLLIDGESNKHVARADRVIKLEA